MTLTQLFTAIANAIRGKKGTQATIKAEDFPTEIAGITTGNLTNEEYQEAMNDADDILENTTVPSGTISITENGNYDVTNYVSANVNIGGNGVLIPNGLKFLSSSCSDMSFLNNLDFSEITSVNQMFSQCNNVTSFPNINTSNVTDFYGMFYLCTSLTTAPTLDTSKATTIASMFFNCSALTDIPVYNTSNVAQGNLSSFVSYCSSLSNASLNNIMQMCINATKYTRMKTLKHVGLTSAQATICTGLSNYSAFTGAGWTTGY